MPSIAPLSREKLKTLRSLASTRIRKRKGICLVEGEKAIGEAARTGYLLYLVLSSTGMDEVTARTLSDRFPDIPVYTLDSRHFADLSEISSGTGILGAARIPPGVELVSLAGKEPASTLVYLDGLQEPGNVGGIIRTSWALGVSGIMLGKGTADPFSAKGVRASAGGVFHIPVCHGVEPGDLRELQEDGYSMFLAQAGGLDLQAVRFSTRSILALGSEGSGFSGAIRTMGQAVGIAMVPGADSLNVVVAGSIILERMRRAG